MTRCVRWGIISTGGIATTFASDLGLIAEGEVAAVGSRQLASAEAFAARFGGTPYGTYEEVCADPAVEAVYVATPHPMHFDNAMMAIEHGKSVLVEKAFTMTAAEARRLVAAARERGVFMMEAMWTRFLPHVVAIREMIAAGQLGELVVFQADHGKYFAPDPTSRLFAPELGGSAMLDLGVYPVSFASMLFGAPTTVLAMAEPAFTGVDGQISMLFGYGNGVHSVLTTTSFARSATKATITGVDGRIEMDDNFYALGGFTFYPRGGDPVRYDFPAEGRGLHYEAQEVARCLDAGLLESPVMPLDETIEIMATMERLMSEL